jgi:hypothetical protein
MAASSNHHADKATDRRKDYRDGYVREHAKIHSWRSNIKIRYVGKSDG